MIRELLLLILLFHVCNGNDYDKCSKDKNAMWLANRNICIPRIYKKKLQGQINRKIIEGKGKQILAIRISNLQVNEITTHTLTIRMKVEVLWLDNRPKVDKTFADSARIYLNPEEEKMIWSPQLVIGRNVVKSTKEGEEVGVIKFSYKSNHMFKNFYITTTVTCNMEFQAFPFDKHICHLEVSLRRKNFNNQQLILCLQLHSALSPIPAIQTINSKLLQVFISSHF